MTQSSSGSSDQSTGSADRPATAQQAAKRSSEQSARASEQQSASSSEPGTFRDGSTKAQQDQLVKEAEEANEQTRELADAERKARSDS
jgi:hypothetical protein